MAFRFRERMGYRYFGPLAKRSADQNPHLRLALERAHILLRPEVYLASAYFTAVAVAVLTFIPLLLLTLAMASGLVHAPLTLLVFIVPAPIAAAFIVYLGALVLPDIRALNRSRDINAKLPYALNYISTMASAGATPEALFDGLARQPLYGEVSQEAAWIVRDIRLLGGDILGALARGIDRSPSAKFQDFLQGATTALTSGGDLKTYFSGKADQFILENRQEQRKFLDSLAVLAESFVTVVVAAPIFLIVILSVMNSFGGNAGDNLTIGYIMILVLMPMAQAGFAWTIKTITPEA